MNSWHDKRERAEDKLCSVTNFDWRMTVYKCDFWIVESQNLEIQSLDRMNQLRCGVLLAKELKRE